MIFLLSLAFADIPEYTYIEIGEPAPFSGRLFNDDASQLIADQIADASDRCLIELDYQVGMVLAKKNEEIQEIRSEHLYQKEVLASRIEEQIERIEKLEALKTPAKKQLWFSLGLVSGIAITISIAKAVQ